LTILIDTSVWLDLPQDPRQAPLIDAMIGLTSRNGNLRTIAAVHNTLNQALASPGALHIGSRMGDTSDSSEINRLSRLGVRDDPNSQFSGRLDLPTDKIARKDRFYAPTVQRRSNN